MLVDKPINGIGVELEGSDHTLGNVFLMLNVKSSLQIVLNGIDSI